MQHRFLPNILKKKKKPKRVTQELHLQRRKEQATRRVLRSEGIAGRGKRVDGGTRENGYTRSRFTSSTRGVKIN